MQFSNQSWQQFRLHHHLPIYCWHTYPHTAILPLGQPNASYYLKPRCQGTGRSNFSRAVVPHLCSDDPEASSQHSPYVLPRVPQAWRGANPAESFFCCPLSSVKWDPVQETPQRCSSEGRTTPSDNCLPLPRGSRDTSLAACGKTSLGKAIWNYILTTQLHISFWSNYSNSLQFTVENSNTTEKIQFRSLTV